MSATAQSDSDFQFSRPRRILPFRQANPFLEVAYRIENRDTSVRIPKVGGRKERKGSESKEEEKLRWVSRALAPL